MRDISPDRTQTLEVIGNDNFEKIVKQLELEGVGINSTNTPPPLPQTIAPEKKRLMYDIVIPDTDFSYSRAYKNLGGIDGTKFPSLFDSDKLSVDRKTLLRMEVMNLGVEVHQAEIESEYIELGRDLTAYIVNQTMKKAGLTDCFQYVYPICEEYILNKCFEIIIEDLEKDELRKVMRELPIQEAIIDLLAKEIGKATVEKKKVTVKGRDIKLSDTPKFTWRRGHIRCEKTVFNFVATYNPFESEFAKFLDKSADIDAFAALANIFRIDYLSNSGAIRYYFPDFVAVQATGKKIVFWILETKGREYPDLENKNKAIERWCKAVTEQTGKEWKYLMVRQSYFDMVKKSLKSFKNLIDILIENEKLL